MDQVEPKEMISLGKVPSQVTRGDQVTVVCNTSNYYFAGGTRIAMKYLGSNDLVFLKGMKWILKSTSLDSNTIDIDWFGTDFCILFYLFYSHSCVS